MNRTKKLVRLIVSLCMIFTLTSAIAFAEETITPIQLGYRGAAMEIEVAGDSETSYFEYGVGGMELVVTGDNAYVVFAGERYEAEDGEVSVLLAGGNPRMPVEFVVGNSGAEAATFTVDFAYPVGSMSNPFVLEEAGYVSAEVAEGNQEGYWITYTAPQAGTLTVEIYGASDADYNELGWTYVVNQITASKYGDNHTSADEELVMSETFEVNENDVIQVMMNTFDAENPWSAPAGTVNAYFTFTPPAGTIDNPIMIEDSDYDTPEVTADITVEAGTSKYYTTTVAETWRGCVVSPYLMVQCSDARFYGKLSNHVYRFSSMDLTTEERRSIHGNNERIRLDCLHRSAEFYIRLLKKC